MSDSPSVRTIFSSDILGALDIDFEPPLPADERLIEMDDEEIIELDFDSTNIYRCSRCHKTFLGLAAFMSCCKGHIPSFQKILYGMQRISRKKSEVVKEKPMKIASKIAREYICDWCGMIFGLRMSLKAHFRVHLNLLEQCPNCDGKFSRKKTLARHVLVVHQGGDKEIRANGNDRQSLNCIYCDRPFESVNNLRVHETSHFNENHICFECGIVCKSEKILKKHQRKHLGLKYPCEICGALLNSLDSLRGHLKYMHSGAKYRCGICGIEYKHRGNYNDHIAGHLDPSSKVCGICNFEWDARRSCLEHKKKKHPEITLDYALPKVDPTDVEKMALLRKLIDALPRHNGKPNHLEVCMMGVTGAFKGVRIAKKSKVVRKKVTKVVKEVTPDEILVPDNEDHSMQKSLDVRKSSRIKERNARKDKSHVKTPLEVKNKPPPKSKPEMKTPAPPDSTLDDLDLELTDDNRSYATRKDPALEEYDPNYDYTASEDIFVNDFLQETDMYDPEFVPKSMTREEPVSRALKPGETLCRICIQPTKAIKTHLEHYHSDCLLDRVCRLCKKVAMCKRDLKEHVKSVHRKQFSAYQLEIMQKKYAIPDNLPPELYCTHCPAKFLARDHLKFHSEVLHPDKKMILDRFDDGSTGVYCKLCEKSFPSQNEIFLKRHVNSSHGHSLADCVCFLCGEVFVVKNYIKIHLKRAHDGMTLDLYRNQCGKKIEAFRNENPEHKCEDCNHSYVDFDDLSYHQAICHNKEIKIANPIIPKPLVFPPDLKFGQITTFKCQICAKVFQKQEIYNKHKEQHDFGLLYCPTCDKHFSGISQRREHDAYKHGIGRKKYTCDHCGEKMTRRKALVAHFQLKCPAFKERPQLKWFCAELKQQIKEEKEVKLLEKEINLKNKGPKKGTLLPFSHGSEKRMCDICAKICCNDYRLMEHGRKVHGIIFPQYEELYRQDCQQTECPDCGKTFFQLSHFIEHKKTHTIELLTCKICGIIVKGKKTLVRHELIHKPKTFKCDKCGMMFHQKRTMTVHKQEKHSTTQYNCKYCPQQFKYKATLYEHLKGHEVPNYLRCELCNKDYASRSCLRTHRKRTHPEIYGGVNPGGNTTSRHQRPQSWNQYVMQIEGEPLTAIVSGDESKFEVEFLHETEIS